MKYNGPITDSVEHWHVRTADEYHREIDQYFRSLRRSPELALANYDSMRFLLSLDNWLDADDKNTILDRLSRLRKKLNDKV